VKHPIPYLLAGLGLLAPQAWGAGLGGEAPFYTIAPGSTSERWQVDGSWQLTANQRLDFGVQAPNRSFAAGIDGTDLRPDYALTGSAEDGDYDFSIYRVDYAVSFLRSSEWDLWGSLGLQMLDLDLATGADSDTHARFSGLERPLPTFGLGGRYAFNPNWNLRGDLRYFSGGRDDWQGNLFDARVAVEYRPFDQVGIGLKYDFVSVDVQDGSQSAQDLYGLRFDRLGIYARLPFD
jgi:opacity protein-like surface antigen